MKVGYLESTKSFYKFLVEIYYYKNCNPHLPYGELKFEDELLNYYFHSVKNLIKKTIIQGTWKILVTKTLPKCPPWYQCYCIVLPLSPLLIKKFI
jgi:hypothetical protein